MHREFRMVENIFEELDAPGEWFHNAKTGTLYYKPEAGTDLNKAVVEVVRLRHLIEFQGSVETPVRFITLQGFTVRHAARTFMDTKEPMLRSDWTIYRGGAVMLTGTEDVKILDCEFDQVGGNAVFVNNYNRRTLVKECHIHDAGASGVCFVGDPDAVHNPLFNYGQKNDLAKIDRTPGAKTENYPALGTVEDCLIHGIGRVERQPAGVQIAMAMEITVRDCSIYDCARAGINIGDGCWGGHLIEGCDVFDTVLETHDHGSFNSWGRDRYWRSDRGTSQAAIDEDPTLPFLDAMKTTVIRDSRWRCDHGWDIDLDDGSSNYDIYNNLMLQGGLKFREGFRRRAWNNITVNNGFHPHVWFNNSEDEVFANIFMSQHKGVRAPTNTARGKKIDENLFFGANPKDQNRLLQLGWDVNSIAADPQFVDPEKGDYRVKASSPAFDIGFKNFPMDQFGVKAPRLRALARTPVLPILKATKEYDSGRNRRVVEWFGAKIKNIVGLGEVSAAGLPGEIGVSLIEVPVKSGAANAGLKVGDVILSCAGRKIETFVDLQRAWRKTSGRVSLEVWRAQKSVMMDVTNNEFTGVKGVTVITESRNNPTFERIMPVSGTDLAQGISPTVNAQTRNEPLATLTDGKLAINYGPVFANGIDNGMYRLDLGAMKAISKINTYSVAQGNRGHQVFCLFGSASADDPGFDVWNTGRFTFIAMVDTLTESYSKYMASSVRGPIGSFRWLVWAVDPINENENSAFQEFDVAGTR